MNKWLNNIQSAIFPPICVLCGSAGSTTLQGKGFDLCAACRNDLPKLTSACVRCAEPLNASDIHEALCGRCQTRPPAFDRCLAMFVYQSPANHILQALKFNGRLEMARLLGELMGEWLEDVLDNRPDVLIPVPLHSARLRERGFNQAHELARPIAKHLGLNIDIHSCRRTRTTAPQSDLSRKERVKNVKGAFEMVSPVSGHVAIIDDVMTTGSTANELATALLQAGASSVDVWICARA